jgi:TPR repeat protein
VTPCNYGFCLANGEGVSKNQEEVVSYFRFTGDQGLAAAQCNCGICLANDKGVSKNQEEAAKYFRLTADQNM